MRSAIVLGLCLLLAAPAAAQPPAEPAETPADPAGWFQIDYLLWWVSKAPIPVPLVTSGSANDAFPGALGQPGTTVLYGGQPQGFGSVSGLRFGLGFWFDEFQEWGMEGNFFMLWPRHQTFQVRSDDRGRPVFAQPIIIPTLGERALATSFPDQFSGSLIADSTLRFYSWEISGVARIVRGDNWHFDALLGFRNIRLSEQLKVESDLTALTNGALTYLAAPIRANSRLVTTDQFGTSTDYYAGQVGARYGISVGQFSAEITGKVAAGLASQAVRVLGITSLYAPPPTTTARPQAQAAGGILAVNSNSPGHDNNARFVVVPQVAARLSYDVLESVRLSAGYEFLYMSDVVRPGNQIDRTINPRQVPSDPGFGTFLAPQRPVLEVKRSAFWANGVSASVEFRF